MPWIGFPRDIIPFPAMETSKPYGNLLCDIALMNWYQGYSWRFCKSESVWELQNQNCHPSCKLRVVCRMRFQFAEWIQTEILQITNARFFSSCAECAFSTMNIICSFLQRRLSVECLSSLTFTSHVGPLLMQFNPLLYIKKWLVHGHSGAYDSQSSKRHATEESRYSHLNKIFE